MKLLRCIMCRGELKIVGSSKDGAVKKTVCLKCGGTLSTSRKTSQRTAKRTNQELPDLDID